MKDSDVSLLFVDDEPHVLSALKRQFRHSGYRIQTVSDGVKALKLLRRNPVDIIIADQLMPGMNGVDLLEKVKAEFPDIKRVILSGYTDLEAILRAINDGNIHKFITKPWEPRVLENHIRELAGLKKLETENEHLHELLEEKKQLLLHSNIRLSIRNAENISRIIEQIPVPLICINHEGIVISANQYCASLPGRLPEKGHTIAQTLPEQISNKIVDDIDALASSSTVYEVTGVDCRMQVAITKMHDPDCYITAVHMLQ